MRARPGLWGEGIGNDPSYPAPREMTHATSAETANAQIFSYSYVLKRCQ